MASVWIVCTFLILGLIAFQDFRDRAVLWLLFPLLSLCLYLTARAYFQIPSFEHYMLNIFINICIVSLQIAGIKGYFHLRHRASVDIINTKIGLGDIWMFYAVAAYFSPLYFITFFLLTLIFSLLIIIIIKLLSANTYVENNVPLAGLMALFLLIFMLLNVFLQLNTLDDLQVVKFLTKA